jgi:hypothetical protein
MSIQKATSLAAKVLDLSWDGRFPVDPKDIAEDLLVRNYSGEHRDEKIPVVVRGRSSYVLDGSSGQARLARDDKGYYYLCEYNSEEISYRNRFTIAHELGHVVLGHVAEGKAPKRDTTFSNNDPDEVDANAFAAALLMPEKFVRKLYRSARNVQELSEAFGVSTVAMTYRLKNLGII